MAGIKYGVWQLHILLIGGIWGVGVWTLSRLIDFVTLLGLVDGFLLGLGYIVWVSSFTDTVVFLALVECGSVSSPDILCSCFPRWRGESNRSFFFYQIRVGVFRGWQV